MTLEQLTEKLDTLNIAIASGVTEVTSGDKTIRYQSVAQVQVAESRLRAVIGMEFDDAGVDRLPLKDIVEKVRQTPLLTSLGTPGVNHAPR
jgi:hypothetical protein